MRNSVARQNAAENVQCTGGDPTDQEKGEVLRTIFRKVADVFKGGKAHGDGNGRSGHGLGLRLEDQKVEQQRQQLHHFLAHRRDLNGGDHGICTETPHKKAADIGRQKTDPHTDGHKQSEPAGLPPGEEQR